MTSDNAWGTTSFGREWRIALTKTIRVRWRNRVRNGFTALALAGVMTLAGAAAAHADIGCSYDIRKGISSSACSGTMPKNVDSAIRAKGSACYAYSWTVTTKWNKLIGQEVATGIKDGKLLCYGKIIGGRL